MPSAVNLDLWGCNLDPLPDMASIRRKVLRHMQADFSDCSGPYDAFLQGRSSEENALSIVPCGQIPCPSAFSATPDFSRPILPKEMQTGIDGGLCRQYAERFEQAAAASENVFLGIAPDHSLTGGAWRHFSRRQDAALIVFDAHLDAFSPTVRNGLAQYAAQTGMDKDVAVYDDGFAGNYDAGSFLYYLIQEGALDPHNLFVFGVESLPDRQLARIRDPRVEAYVEQYRRLVKAGAVILSAAQMEGTGPRELKERFGGCLRDRAVYVSCDLDAFKGRLGQSTRFGNGRGMLEQTIQTVLNILGCHENVVAADLMEADINRFKETGMTRSLFSHKLYNVLSYIFAV